MKITQLLLRLVKRVYFKPGFPRFPALLANIPEHTSFKEVFEAWSRPLPADPILLLSYPRSGSSWLGEVLSSSPDLAYLREPITQSLGQKHNYYALIYPDMDLITMLLTIQYADLAFSGIAAWGIKNILFHPQEFSVSTANRQRLLIKEVNPLAIDFIYQRYRPTTLLLIRHPAAIADSFHRMGWLSAGWENFGFEYGQRIQRVINCVPPDKLSVLLYEDFARDPATQIPALHQSLFIQKHPDLGEIIELYSQKKSTSYGPYQTKRYSFQEIEKWKRNLSEEIIAKIKRGFLKSNLGYYQTDTVW